MYKILSIKTKYNLNCEKLLYQTPNLKHSISKFELILQKVTEVLISAQRNVQSQL